MTNGGKDAEGRSIIRFGRAELALIGGLIVGTASVTFTGAGILLQNLHDHADFRKEIEDLRCTTEEHDQINARISDIDSRIQDRWSKADDNAHMVEFARENDLDIVSHKRVSE